jgi:predicted alpha/beta hydrolase
MTTAVEFQTIESEGNIKIPVAAYVAKGARAALLMLPAMGVRAGFYRKFAEQLMENGITVFLMEQRGHGHSPYRASRSHDFACRDYVDEDIKTTLRWAKDQISSDIPFYLGGHSMGGHMAVCYAGLYGDEIDGLMTIACGLPHADVFDGKVGRRITKLARLLPLILLVWGYFPGERIGFAGREFKSFMKDWLQMVKTGNYGFQGMRRNIEDEIRKFTKPVHIFSVEDDDFAPVRSAEAIGLKFINAPVYREHLEGEILDGFKGHFDWVKGKGAIAARVAGALTKHREGK